MSNNAEVGVKIVGKDEISVPLKQIESSIIRFVGAVTASLSAIRIAAFPVQAAAEFQKEMLNVKKTTEFGAASIRALSRDIIEMSRNVNVSAVDLAKIAGIAGQLGLGSSGEDALAKFTESAARFSSVLDVTVEDAANGIAKITNIFHIAISETERISSAFNEVSNNSTASGSDLLDVVKRIGNAAGAINLQQSLGLAATGVDVGMSLETIGTSFTKIFANMEAKADLFGQFMKMSTMDWADTVRKDGIGALKLYLDKLRELNPAAQARIITELSGGGRIFSLVTKLADDYSNSILNKNIANADSGWSTGTSSIREQQTVLQGLSAQFTILKNNITAVGLAMGETTLPYLTALTKELSAFFASPGAKEGFSRIADDIGALVRAVVDGVKWVAALNINWIAFIKAGEIFIALKLAQTFTGLYAAIAKSLGGLGELAGSLKNIKGTVVNAAGLNSFAEASTNASAARLAAMEHNAALEVAIQNETAAAEAVTMAKRILVSGEQVAARKLQLVEIDVAEKLQNSVANKLILQRAELQAAVAGGASKKEIAALQAHHAQVLNQTAAYWERRLVIERAALVEEQTLLRANVASMELLYKQQAAVAIATAETAAAASVTAAAVAATATYSISAVAGAVMASLGKLLGLLSKVAIWATVVYTILDMTGLLGKLGEGFNYVTDKLGLTNSAMEKTIANNKKLAEESRKAKDESIAAAEAYSRQVLANKEATPEAIGKGIAARKGPEQYTDFAKRNVTGLISAQGYVSSADDAVAQAAALFSVQTTALTKLKTELNKILADKATLEKQREASSPTATAFRANVTALMAQADADIALKKQEIGTATASLQAVSAEQRKRVLESTAMAKSQIETFSIAAQAAMTPHLYKVAEDTIQPYIKLTAELRTASAEAEKLKNAGTLDTKQTQELVAWRDKVTELNTRILALNTTITAERANLKGGEAIQFEVLMGLPTVKEIDLYMAGLKSHVAGFRNDLNLAFTGAGTTSLETKPKLDARIDPTDTANAVAHLARSRAEAEAQAQKDYLEQRNTLNEALYAKDLVGFTKYQKEKLEIALKTLDVEIAAKKKEIAAEAVAMGTGKTGAVRVEAEAKKVGFESQLAALERKRSTAKATGVLDTDTGLKAMADRADAELAQYFDAHDQKVQAGLLRLRNSDRDVRKKLDADLAAAMAGVSAGSPGAVEQKTAAENAIEVHVKMVGVEAAKTILEDITAKLAQFEAAQGTKESAIQGKVDRGELDPASGAREILRLRNETAEKIKETIPSMEALNGLMKDPAVAAAIANYNVKMADLGHTVSAQAKVIDDAFVQGIAKGLEGLMNHTKSLKDAFLDLGKAILGAVIQTIALNTAKSMVGTASLGSFLGFADGGYVSGPGTGTSDSIPAALSNGEYVMTAEQTAAWLPALEAMRSGNFVSWLMGTAMPVSYRIPTSPRFAEGGIVSKAAQGGGASPVSIEVNVDASGTSVAGEAGKSAELGKVIASAVQTEIVKQKRPGGLLA